MITCKDNLITQETNTTAKKEVQLFVFIDTREHYSRYAQLVMTYVRDTRAYFPLTECPLGTYFVLLLRL